MQTIKSYQGQYSFDEVLPLVLAQEDFCRYLKERGVNDWSETESVRDELDASMVNEYVRINATFPDLEPDYDAWVFAIVGAWGVYRVTFQESDDITYFVSIDDAKACIRSICLEPGYEFDLDEENLLPKDILCPAE